MGLLARWRARRRPSEPVYADDGSLPVLVVAADPARADSAVLAEAAGSGLDLTVPLLVRHHLLLPDLDAARHAADVLADEGWSVSAGTPGPLGLPVRVSRTQVLTALDAARERSRMAGLAQRLGGDVAGWDACGPQDVVGPR